MAEIIAGSSVALGEYQGLQGYGHQYGRKAEPDPHRGQRRPQCSGERRFDQDGQSTTRASSQRKGVCARQNSRATAGRKTRAKITKRMRCRRDLLEKGGMAWTRPLLFVRGTSRRRCASIAPCRRKVQTPATRRAAGAALLVLLPQIQAGMRFPALFALYFRSWDTSMTVSMARPSRSVTVPGMRSRMPPTIPRMRSHPSARASM